jgi:CheY-like chemotaxis protein
LADDRVRSAIEFFAERVSHDFNNIITPVLAYPDMLLPLLKDERCIRLVRAMQEAAERALEMSQSIGALAGGGSSRVAAECLNISSIVTNAVSAVRQQLQGDGSIVIEDIITPNCKIFMQQEMFVRVLEAILENAIRSVSSTQQAGRIQVVVEHKTISARQGIGGVPIPDGVYNVLSVLDNGLGMSAEDVKYAVEPFVSGFSGVSSCGAGMGLAIAFCSVRRNGAFMEIETQLDAGTCVSVYLPPAKDPVRVSVPTSAAAADLAPRYVEGPPAAIPPTAAPPAAVAAPPVVTETVPACSSPSPSDATRVLVVDDESSIVNLFKMILENFIPGIMVDTAGNGAEGLELFKRNHYPVIVMDLHMPVMDGQSAYFAMEEYCKANEVMMPSVVFCTGYAPHVHLRQAVESERRHMILNKPVQSDVLVQAVMDRLEPGSV